MITSSPSSVGRADGAAWGEAELRSQCILQSAMQDWCIKMRSNVLLQTTDQRINRSSVQCLQVLQNFRHLAPQILIAEQRIWSLRHALALGPALLSLYIHRWKDHWKIGRQFICLPQYRVRAVRHAGKGRDVRMSGTTPTSLRIWTVLRMTLRRPPAMTPGWQIATLGMLDIVIAEVLEHL